MQFSLTSFLLLSSGLFLQVLSHSWMSCPRSFNTAPDRGGDTKGPCEAWYKGAVNQVKAGDRVKVGWTSNNHAGGYIRLALVPDSQKNNRDAYKKNVIKFACYGHDQRPGETKYGDCKHPCNGRPGCQYQSDMYDTARYDTTITVPYNLADGVYVLQYVAALGNEAQLYYSCAKLQVTGGKPGLNCVSSGNAPTYKCRKEGGLPMNSISAGTKKGDFCFRADKVGNADDHIRDVPINVDCDPRITCSLSISSNCIKQQGMKDITDPWNPKQKCGPISPPPPPTCSDKVQNQGEEDVDCGGPNCDRCPPPPPGSNTGYEEYIKHHKTDEWSSGFVANVEVKIKKYMPGLWQLTIFFDNPVKIVQHWSSDLVSVNEFNTIFVFRGKSWNSYLKAGSVLRFGYKGDYMKTKATPKTVYFECHQCSKVPGGKFSLRAHSSKVARSCEELSCGPGYLCDEQKVFPCRSFPCLSEARCIRA